MSSPSPSSSLPYCSLRKKTYYSICSLLICCISLMSIDRAESFVLPGKFDFTLDQENPTFTVTNRGLYNNTAISIKIECEGPGNFRFGWLLRLSECIDEFSIRSDQIPENIFPKIYRQPGISLAESKFIYYKRPKLKEYTCQDSMSVIEVYNPKDPGIIKIEANPLVSSKSSSYSQNPLEMSRIKRQVQFMNKSAHVHHDFDQIAKTWQDGAYMFMVYTEPSQPNSTYSIKATLSFNYGSGYLSANDWPFLPFYGVMCGIYSLYGIFWLIALCCYWRDLLRIQLWIGIVILLGLMEKAAYLAEYDGVNRHGYSVKVAVLVAEVVSCFKRSLARMLVIIVSLGFGIVKPRLGSTMQKVVGLGSIYFVLALVDSVFRIIERTEDKGKGVLAGIPLVVIEVSICYWILTNLQQTMRTLRVRRNISKLSLYRHFTNTLIFCVLASVIFMIWSLKRHRFVACLKDWKELWLDESFWHILFSFILLVIIILWRPSNNSQRFAFSPLIDEDDDDDIDVEMQESEIFDTVKMRSKSEADTKAKIKAAKNATSKSDVDDALKWVEENVPSTITEAALPGLADSEEEIMTTRFEMSKMD